MSALQPLAKGEKVCSGRKMGMSFVSCPFRSGCTYGRSLLLAIQTKEQLVILFEIRCDDI